MKHYIKTAPHGQQQHFQGYARPNYTPVPDELFDEQLADLSGAELKVLLYIMRRTFGFKKESDTISLSQICKGIVGRDGEVLDRGTGLSLSTAQRAIAGLIEKKAIVTTKNKSKERGNEATTYRLNMLSHTPSTENRYRGLPKIGKALYRKSVIQETVVQEKEIQYRNSSVKTDEKKTEKRAPEEHQKSTSSYQKRPSSTFTSLKTLLSPHPISPATPPPHHSASPGLSFQPSPAITSAIGDISLKLHDRQHTRHNMTQAMHIFQEWGKSEEAFISRLYEAQSITRQQRNVKKQMPYFFQVLRDILHIEHTQQAPRLHAHSP